MLRWRLSLGAIFIAAIIGLCWMDVHSRIPGLWLFPLGALIVALASGEIVELLRCVGLKPLAGVVLGSNLTLFAMNWTREIVMEILPASTQAQLALNAGLINRLEWAAAALPICVLVAFAAAMRRYEKPGESINQIAATVFAIVYVGLMMCFVVQLRINWNMCALASMIIVVKMSDTGAYTVGRLIGRHKMAPVLSPGKTIEGAFGAIAFAVLGSWFCFHLLWPIDSSNPGLLLGGAGWIVYGAAVGAAGIFGDLAESLIKRDAQRKDSSAWMPGFGGILDIVDSILLAAPVAWLCWALGLVVV